MKEIMGNRPKSPAADRGGRQDGAQSEREKRLAEALRANLRRRKEAQKPHAGDAGKDDFAEES